MINNIIAQRLLIAQSQVNSTINLLDEGATIPFISRYRKEATQGLDEVQIGAIKDELDRLRELAKRKETILSTIEEQGKLTAELRQAIENSWDATQIEDIYLPYKPKRQTRAEAARKRGLEPLAKTIMEQRERNVELCAEKFLTDEVPSTKEALQGARDIVSEWINEATDARNIVRNSFSATAVITSKVIKGKEQEGDKYLDMFDWSSPLKRCSSHRLLALRRAEGEGILRVAITPDMEGCTERLERHYIHSSGPAAEQMREAVGDALKRLLKPSIETEFAALAKERADREAITVFATNLRQLLLAAPLGQKRVLGIDPGFRTGCKVVCLDAQGTLLHFEAIYPHEPQKEWTKSIAKIAQLVEIYKIEAIAIGNGTASRQTEDLVRAIHFPHKTEVYVVSENGASIYSASKVARDEFPDKDVTVRGAVSIARRLADPLAELVKIEPKSLGVGQYQHDVDQTALKKSLDQTVESCVNMVGVDLNTASKHLLNYVSGIGSTLAQNIIDYRTTNGAFTDRRELLKVPRMGPKAFEQCAGFLRIRDGRNPLDNSAVHPESYRIIEQMASDLGTTVGELIANKELKRGLKLERYITPTIGLPTLKDIIAELDKPGRDPREKIRPFEFDPSVRSIGDLREGMILPGIVSNITDFGCFVDIGIKENGLVHLSQMADRYVSSAADVVRLHEQITVRVVSIDLDRKRIQLSLKGLKNV